MRSRKFFVFIVAICLSLSMGLAACTPGNTGPSEADQQAADAVVLLIDAIPANLSSLALASDEIMTAKSAVEAAFAAYNGLTDAQKALIAPAKETKLGDAQEWLESVDFTKRPIALAEAKIDAIPSTDMSTWTATEIALIDAAKTAYNALGNDEKLEVNADKKAKLNAAIAWSEGAEGAIALITSIILDDIGLSSQDLVARAKMAYDALDAGQKSFVTSTQATKLNDAITAINGLIDAAKPYQVFLHDGTDYAGGGTFYSILDAVNTVISNQHKPASDSVTPFDGEYIIERATGNIVFRETNSGNPDLGNNNGFYLYSGNKLIGTPAYSGTLYEDTNAADNDHVLVHSATGIVASGIQYRTPIIDVQINTGARFLSAHRDSYFDNVSNNLDTFNKIQLTWNLSQAQIYDPTGTGVFELYMGLNFWGYEQIIGIYMDNQTGDWRIFQAVCNAPGGLVSFKPLTYEFFDGDEDPIVATSVKDIFDVWHPTADITMSLEVPGDSLTEYSDINFKITNLSTNVVTDHEWTTAKFPKTMDGENVIQAFYPHYGANFPGVRAENSATKLNDRWSGAFVRNLVLTNALGFKPTGADFAYFYKQNAIVSTRSSNVSAETVYEEVDGVPTTKIIKQIFNFNFSANPMFEANEPAVTATATTGTVNLSMLGTASRTAVVELEDYINYSTADASVKYWVVNSNTAVATVSAIADRSFTATAVAGGNTTITIRVVQYGHIILTINLTITVDNSPSGLIVAIDSLYAKSGSMTASDEAEVYALLTAYDNLEESEQSTITNYAKLTTLKTEVDGIVAAAVDLLIDAIVFTQNSDLGLIDAAQNAFDALNLAQKALVEGTSELNAAITKAANARATISLISALGDTVNFAGEAALRAAESSYNALVADEKALIDSAKITKLNGLIDSIDAQHATLVDGYFDAVSEISTTFTKAQLRQVLDARDAYNALSPKQKALVTSAKLTAFEAIETGKFIAEFNSIIGSDIPSTIQLINDDLISEIYSIYLRMPSANQSSSTLTNKTKLLDSVEILGTMYVTQRIYDVYLYNEEEATFVKSSSYYSVLEAVRAVLASTHKPLATSTTTNDGEYVKERNTGMIVFRETNGGTYETNNNNVFYMYRNNMLVGIPAYEADLYTSVNAMEDDTVLVHSANGVVAFGMKYAAEIIDGEKDSGVRYKSKNYSAYAFNVFTLNAFTQIDHRWNLSQTKITAPTRSGSYEKTEGLHIYYGANFWDTEYRIGIYLDMNSGEWKFYTASKAVGSAYNALTTTYTDIVALRSLPTLTNVFVGEADIKITVKFTTTQIQIAVQNLTTMSIVSYSLDNNANPGVNAYALWGMHMGKILSAAPTNANLPDHWSIGSVKNLVLATSLLNNGGFTGGYNEQAYVAQRSGNVSVSNVSRVFTFGINETQTIPAYTADTDTIAMITTPEAGKDFVTDGVSVEVGASKTINLADVVDFKTAQHIGYTTNPNVAMTTVTNTATVDLNGKEITITGVAVGSVEVTVYIIQYGLPNAPRLPVTFTVTVTAAPIAP